MNDAIRCINEAIDHLTAENVTLQDAIIENEIVELKLIRSNLESLQDELENPIIE